MVYKREYVSKDTHKPVWTYQFQLRGETFKESGFISKADAEKAEADLRRKLQGEARRTIPVKRATLNEFMPLYTGHRATTNAPSTAVRDKSRLKPFLKLHGDRLVSRISVADLHEYVAMRKNKGLANRTVNLEINALRCVFNYADELGMLQSNPMGRVKNLRETTKIDHWIPSPEELARFAAEAEKTYSGPVLAAWIWTMAYTGMRPSEALFLEWQDIDFEAGRILIKPKPGNPLKTGKARYVEIHPELKPKLLAWREAWEQTFEQRARRHPDEPEQPHRWVFYNPHGQKRRAISFLRCFQQARKNSGLPKMTPYSLRHFFISYCVMNGIASLTIARWVGHNSSKMIEQVYGHLTPDYRAEQMMRFRIYKDDERKPEQADAGEGEDAEVKGA